MSDKEKLDALRAHLDEGLAQLDRGEGISITVKEVIQQRLKNGNKISSEELWASLRSAVQVGIDSGEGRPFDEQVVADICARGRKRLADD